jgi:hypothetical protein
MVIFEANAFKEFARIRILAERCQNELAFFARQQGAVLKQVDRRCCKLASALFIAGKKNRVASFGLTSPARIRHARHKAVLAMLF